MILFDGYLSQGHYRRLMGSLLAVKARAPITGGKVIIVIKYWDNFYCTVAPLAWLNLRNKGTVTKNIILIRYRIDGSSSSSWKKK